MVSLPNLAAKRGGEEAGLYFRFLNGDFRLFDLSFKFSYPYFNLADVTLRSLRQFF